MAKLVWKQIAQEDGAPLMKHYRFDGLPFHFKVWRAKVPGGWLITGGVLGSFDGSVSFMPDPEHVWDVEEVKQPEP